MERREALASIASALAAAGVLVSTETLEAAQLSDEAIEGMLKELAGVTPLPGEGSATRQFLLSLRYRAQSDPRLQPAVAFDPDIAPG